MHDRICFDLDVTELSLQHQDVFNSTNAAINNMKLACLVMPLNIDEHLYPYLMHVLARVLVKVPHSLDVRMLMSACNVLKTST